MLLFVLEPLAEWVQIKQVLLNLLLNALGAQGEEVHEKGQAEGPILIEGIKNSKGVGFTILDHGPGIPENVLEEIFNPFFTTKEIGIGFGLSIIYRILEQHYGQITLTNRVNGGIRAEVYSRKKGNGY